MLKSVKNSIMARDQGCSQMKFLPRKIRQKVYSLFSNIFFHKALLGADMRTGPRLEPRYKEVLRQNVLAIPRFRYIEVLFHIFYYYWGKEDCSLHPGLRYIEVRYIKVPQYTLKKLFCRNASSPPPPPHKNKSTSLNYRARSIQP